MKVTGWTWWGDPQYIDIIHDAYKERMSFYNANCIPLEQYKTLTPEQQLKSLEHSSQMMKSYDKEHNNILTMLQDMNDVVVGELRQHGYHFTGDSHQNYDFGCPIIDDKYIYCVSQRDWGEIIFEAFPDEDYSDYRAGREYLKWSWTPPKDVECCYPMG